MPTFVIDRPGLYQVQLVVRDGYSQSFADTVVIDAAGGNVAPVARAGHDQIVFVSQTVHLDGSRSFDANGDALTYRWTLSARPAGSQATLSDAASVRPTFVPDLEGDYVARLVVNDGLLDSAPRSVTIHAGAGNTPPVANAGLDQTSSVGATAFLDGSGSSDADGDPLIFEWRFVSKPEGSHAQLSGAATSTPSFFVDVDGRYVIQLRVCDDQVFSEPDTIVVTTQPGNSTPVADAGPDQTVDAGALVALNGSGSSDADGDALSFAWSLITRPAGSNAQLSDPGVPQPTFTADVSGNYVAQLIVNDGQASSQPDTAVIAVRPAVQPQVSIANAAINEGNSGTSALNFTVTLDQPAAQAVTVSFATANGSAQAGSDYVAASGTVTFAANDVSETIAVTINGDTLFEASETLVVNLANPVNATIADNQATGTINNDDTAPTLSIADTSVSEGNAGVANVAFTVTQSAASGLATSVSFATADGTATAPADYVATNGILTFAAGVTTQTITVPVNGDTVVEPNESFAVTLSNPTNASLADGLATGTITDDDVLPVVSINANDANAAEAGSDTGAFTVSRSGSTAGALTVNYAVGGNATNGTDYQSIAASVTIANGQSSATVTITPVDDALSEGSESVVLTLSANAAYSIGTPGAATVTIADNDLPTVTIVATDAAAAEAGNNTGTFTVNRTGPTTSSLSVSVGIGGTATNGGDYAGISSLITLAAGQASATVTITPAADNLVEGDESVALTINANALYTVGTPTSATVTIADDPAIVNISATDATAAEVGTNSGTFTVTRAGGNLAATLSVTVGIGGTATNGGDYSGISSIVSIPANQPSATVTIAPLADNLVEGSETVVLTISASSTYSIGAAGTATVTIADDPAIVSINATDASASEVGPDGGMFTVTRAGGNQAAALSVSVGIGGTATNGGDYAGISSLVSIPANQASATVTIAPLPDNVVEGSETVVLTINTSTTYSIGASGNATVNIADNPAVVSVTASDAGATEGGDTGTFTFARVGGNQAAALSVSVGIGGTATNGGDYTGISSLVSIPANQASTTVTISALADALTEGNETVVLTLNTSTLYQVGTPGSATVTIADAVLPAVTIAAPDASASEAGNPGSFAITRTGSSASPLTVNLTISGNATNGTDYQSIATTFVIQAGQTTGLLPVTPIDDALNEGTETVFATVAAGAGYSVGSPSQASVTIDDDDVPLVSVAATDATATEAGSTTGTYTLTRTGDLTQALFNVNFTMSGTAINGGDYSLSVGAVSFPANQASVTVTLTATNDGTVEGDETAILTLSDGASYNVGTPAAATVNIIDNVIPVVTVVATDATATEAGSSTGTYTLSRTGDLSLALFNVNFTMSGTATNGGDYSLNAGAVSFPANQASVTVTLTASNDTLVEGDETAILTVSDGANHNVGTPGAATINVVDNVTPIITVAATAATATEAGSTIGTYTLTRTGDLSLPLFNVNFTMSGSATNGGDYNLSAGGVSFPANQATVTVTLTASNDALVEGDETAILTISDGANYDVGTPGAATINVIDNVTPVITVAPTDPTATEAGSTTGTYTLTRTGDLSLALFNVNFTMGGTAINGGDYSLSAGAVSFPANQATVTVTLTANNDALVEGDETAILTLSDGANYNVGTPGAATITITSDE
jgi:hypothetical protein